MSLRIDQMLASSNLSKHLAEKSITRQKHPDLNLYIYNYSPAVQYMPEMWDNETETCRGLVVSGAGEIVARGFRKFFNLNTSYRPETHLAALPQSRPQVMEKMDGSLGILWQFEGMTGIATRGSFTSPQSVWASTFYNDHCKIMLMDMHYPRSVTWPDGFTPLFEIIYPENRIVVKYDYKALVLIGLINKSTGQEATWDHLRFWAEHNKFPVATLYEHSLEEAVADKGKGNDEGFVLTWFQPHLKVKVKFEEYCRLHRVITGMNAKTVWEMFRDGKQNELTDLCIDPTLPFEFRQWLTKLCDDLYYEHQNITTQGMRAWSACQKFATRKEQAAYVLGNHIPISAAVFALLDGKDPKHIIWKMLRPQATKPFAEEI